MPRLGVLLFERGEDDVRDPPFAAILEGLLRYGQATLSDLEGHLNLAVETLRDHLRALSTKGLVERAGVRGRVLVALT